MISLLIFDSLNDLLYKLYDPRLETHLREILVKQTIHLERRAKLSLNDDYLIVKFFAPLVTSHRLMNSQFGNTYHSIQCEGGLNVCFKEFLGFLFVSISFYEEVSKMQNALEIYVTIVRLFCGVDIRSLGTNARLSKYVDNLINIWNEKSQSSEYIMLEAFEQLKFSQSTGEILLDIVKQSTQKIRRSQEKMFCIVIRGEKLLTFYTSHNSDVLPSADIVLLFLLSQSMPPNSEEINLQLFLHGNSSHYKCVPHLVHVININSDTTAIYALEHPIIVEPISCIFDIFVSEYTLQSHYKNSSAENIRESFDCLDRTVRALVNMLKKNKISVTNTYTLYLNDKWSSIRKLYIDLIKSDDNNESLISKIECVKSGFLDNLLKIFQETCTKKSLVQTNPLLIEQCVAVLTKELYSMEDQLIAEDYFPQNLIMREFPGLVHFLFLDRNFHRIFSPTLDEINTHALRHRHRFISKIEHLVEFSKQYLKDGNTFLTWKNGSFCYTYILWFEDITGNFMTPHVKSSLSKRPLPRPGIISTDFYSKLREACFPKMNPRQIKCYELYCVHLEYTPSFTIVEQLRRLISELWETLGMQFTAAVNLL